MESTSIDRVIGVRYFSGQFCGAFAACIPGDRWVPMDDCVLHRRPKTDQETVRECIAACAEELATKIGLFGQVSFCGVDGYWYIFLTSPNEDDQ